jgi:arginase
MPTLLLPHHVDDPMPGLSRLVPDAVPVTAPLGTGDVWDRLVPLYDVLADAVSGVAASGPVRVVSGGCNASAGVVAGLQRAGLDPVVVWFDAHGDVQTLETTASGYPGGIALRLLVGYRPELIAEGIGLRPLAEDRVVLVDARDLDPPEVDYLADAGIRRRTVTDLAVDDLPDGPVLLHIDLDVVDAAALPGLRFPAASGPTAAEVVAAAGRVVASGRVVALDLACTWASETPDPDGARARLLTALLA